MTRWPVANSALNLWEGRPWAARVRPTESSDLARGLSEPKLQVLSAPVVLPASVLVEPRPCRPGDSILVNSTQAASDPERRSLWPAGSLPEPP